MGQHLIETSSNVRLLGYPSDVTAAGRGREEDSFHSPGGSDIVQTDREHQTGELMVHR